jgi:hypothetical protein
VAPSTWTSPAEVLSVTGCSELRFSAVTSPADVSTRIAVPSGTWTS